MLLDVRRLAIALASSAILACGGGSPPAPVLDAPGGTQTITGTERIGWDQPAADAVELAAIRYAIYIDNTRSELSGAACVPAPTVARFSCTARLPALGIGAHTLQIASFVVDGSLLESARSGALAVNVVRATASSPLLEPATRPDGVNGANGAAGRIDAIGGMFDTPVDIAVARDGRLFVAERAGRISVILPDRVPAVAAISLARFIGANGRLLALALDPQFERTGFVFVLYASTDGFTIARLRESGDTLGDLIVVLDRVPVSTSPAGTLRFGPDGKLYAAFDDGGEARRAGDPASLNGKVVRMNTDGTTPADQPGATPVVASDLVAPTGLAWQPSNGALWIADRRDGRSAQLRVIHGPTVAAYALPLDAPPTSLAFSPASGADGSDALLVGSDGDARLLRVAIDRNRPAGTRRLLRDGVDVVRALTIARDGSMYFAGSDRVGTLAGVR
jgi:glucose/arabinose dehydrogenase